MAFNCMRKLKLLNIVSQCKTLALRKVKCGIEYTMETAKVLFVLSTTE